jgi:hypothetical protein
LMIEEKKKRHRGSHTQYFFFLPQPCYRPWRSFVGLFSGADKRRIPP